MNKQQPIVRRSLHGEIIGHLRDMIIGGELKGGQKVPETQLCQRFGVSRTPMREALKVLAAEGLLQLLPNRGAVVAKITREEVEELFPIIGALEALAGELACSKINDQTIAAIRRLHDRMVSHFRRGEWLPYSKLNRAIHEAIFVAAGNSALLSLYQQMLFRIHSVRFATKSSQARWKEAVTDHEAILAAIEKRDGRNLSMILTVHLRHKAEMVKETLARLGEEPQ